MELDSEGDEDGGDDKVVVDVEQRPSSSLQERMIGRQLDHVLVSPTWLKPFQLTSTLEAPAVVFNESLFSPEPLSSVGVSCRWS